MMGKVSNLERVRNSTRLFAVLAPLVFASCTGILQEPSSSKSQPMASKLQVVVEDADHVLVSYFVSLNYEGIPKDVSSYCILENSTDVSACTWAPGPLPSTYESETGDGTKRLSVWTRDKRTRVSKMARTQSFVIDTTAPNWTTPGITHSAVFTSLTLSPSITFNKNATDLVTEVSYEYAIGTGSGISNRANIKNWTEITTTPFQVSGLSLTNGQTYYVSMRAVDAARNSTVVTTSSGWTVNTASLDPAYGSISPPSPATSTTPVLVGTAGASVQTVNIYSDAACTVSIGSGTRADFIGTGITLNVPSNPATATSIYAQGVDGGSNSSACVLMTTYQHDNVAPSWTDSLSLASATLVSLTAAPQATYTADATDGGSGVSGYQYSVGTTSGGTEIRNWTSTGGSPFTASGMTLTDNTTYYLNIRAIDGVGLSSTVYTESWLARVSPILSYSASTGTTGAVGAAMSVSPSTLTSNGTGISNCTASPALPAWASISSTTCVISGTPTGTMGATTYTITVTNVEGYTSTATVDLTVNANTPILSYANATGRIGKRNVLMSVAPTTLNDRGAAITACGIKPATTALPAWASVNATTCVISGTPTATLAATTYTLRATNSAGVSADATVSLSVVNPTGSILIANGTPAIHNTEVLLDLSAWGADEMYVTDTADCSAGGTWETISTVKNWTLPNTNATNTVAVKYRNSGGIESPCYTDTIVHDNVAPAAPGFSSFNPASPNASITPTVIGTSSADTTAVSVFADAACTREIGNTSGSKATWESTGITLNLMSGLSYDIYAYSTDASGNRSACTLMGTYVNNGTQASNTWEMLSSNTNEFPELIYQGINGVWTGHKYVIWGRTTGWAYDPVTDTWKELSRLNAPIGRVYTSIVAAGSEVIVWGGYTFNPITFVVTSYNSGARYDVVTDVWTTMSTTSAPTGRSQHSAVWTGTEMIVWGGKHNSTVYASGGRYNPATNTWSSMASAAVARYYHSVLWTGNRMIVWGGTGSTGVRMDTGAVYNPTTNTWTTTQMVNAPSARYFHSSVWAGSKKFVFGGSTDSGSSNQGKLYDPFDDSWQDVSSVGGPSARTSACSAWTGSKVIVWGGSGGAGVGSDGALYDPTTDTWSAMSTTNAPESVCNDFFSGWIGSRFLVNDRTPHNDIYMANPPKLYDPVLDTWSTAGATSSLPTEIVFATWDSASSKLLAWSFSEGGAAMRGQSYDPTTDSWASLNNVGAPYTCTACLNAGSKIILWNSYVNSGGVYDIVADSWSAMSNTGSIQTESSSVVWTGTDMIIWGGYDLVAGAATTLGAKYNLAGDTWSPISSAGAPEARTRAATVWTGSKMIVWGGHPGYTTGGVYDPVLDTWTATSNTGVPAGRIQPIALWTGTHMLVWAGHFGGGVSGGSRYNLATNTWSAITTTGAPSADNYRVGVWTGSKMIVWGGLSSLAGGVYDPVLNSWSAMNMSNSPSTTGGMMVWTGSKAIAIGDTSIGAYVP